MGCTPSKTDLGKKYEGDTQWRTLASSGKALGMKTWGEEIVSMHPVHPNLFMGSRLSAQAVIDKRHLKDMKGQLYPSHKFNIICVASEKTCMYCEMSSKFHGYDIQDRMNQQDDFLGTAIKTAKHIHNMLTAGKLVLVHCHMGRNRSALAVLVYAGLYTDMTYENALYRIRLCNSSRFSMQSTLQNTQFTSTIRTNWKQLRDM
jgi:predicted protein tyrosine phosphatase